MNRVFMPFFRVILLEILSLVLLIGFAGNASSSSVANLGEVEFKTSGSEKAQQHFLHGLAALHSFWYKEALDAFRKSTEIDPDFAMGYWGEAMAHNHPLWEEQDIEAAKKVLSKIPDNAKISSREKDYINAVRILYGIGEKQSRDEAYSKAMDNLRQNYPDDLEAACFYALSLLGSARGAENKFHMNVQAGAIGLEIFQKKPNHPCAAHYTIHAFDHPDLAVLALPAARRYAQIAPASHHAQHMPAHIFVQLGMWPEAAKANNAGWMSSIAWVEREGLPKEKRGYHSLQWLHYVLLQQNIMIG
jgi:tetratricopeptide (TPR) repeat protein